jgi:hypothetical protein
MSQKARYRGPHKQHKFAAAFLALMLLAGCGGIPAGTVPETTAGTEPETTAAMTDSTAASSSSESTVEESTEPATTTDTDTSSTSATPSLEPSASPVPTEGTEGNPDGTTGSGDGQPADSGRTVASFDGKPVKVRAVYVSGPMAGFNLDHYIGLVDKTELNALVIDIKEGGYVNYETNAAMCHELGLYKKNFKVDAVLAKCHEKGIYVIGRIVVFRDNALARKKPEYAIRKPDGSAWLENKNKDGAWTSPAVKGVLDYNIEIAKEAIERGFDEIQFDYVRFPTVPKTNPAVYPSDMPDKIDVISGFLQRASDEIKTVREVPVSADVFGIIAESVSDGKAIGQQLEMVGKDVDYLSPMVYPSHYANAGKGVTMGNGVGQQINGILFTAPDLHPYDVVKQTLLKIKKRSDATPGFKAGIRPYLQDFTASYIKNLSYYQTYGAVQIRQQIKAVYDAGYEEWILWNGRNIYSESGLLAAQPQ